MSKTNYSYVGISFIILVFGIIFIPRIISRVSGNDIVREGSRSEDIGKQMQKKSDLVFIQRDGAPRKVPSFSFTNQFGNTITQDDYKGKVYVVEFFFTTCPTICIPMNLNLIQVQNAFKDEANFGIASFSIMPETDTPEVLKKYADEYGVTNPNWHLMTGNRAHIYELANSGFNLYAAVNPDVEGGFEHSGYFALIDKNGFIRSRTDNFGNPKVYYRGTVTEKQKYNDEGEEEEISVLKEDIAKLLKEK